MTAKLTYISGDGIGPEIMVQVLRVLDILCDYGGLKIEREEGYLGGNAYDRFGTPLPDQTLDLAKESDAILFVAAGGSKWDTLPRDLRPERALLRMRYELELFANLRPALTYPELASSSTLKDEVVSGLDILIVRELTGGIYFGEPRGIMKNEAGKRYGINTLTYDEDEISRIAHVAFRIARQRDSQVCSVDKANVLETTELWREVVTEVGADYPDVGLQHMLVDNAAMQLVRDPKQFDVIVTTNMFGDILSDISGMLTGSIGMLPSASLDKNEKGLYEPDHGTAPDIAGRNEANPLATILSLAMLLDYSLKAGELAEKLRRAAKTVIEKGLRTPDIHTPGMKLVGTSQMGDAVVEELRALLN